MHGSQIKPLENEDTMVRTFSAALFAAVFLLGNAGLSGPATASDAAEHPLIELARKIPAGAGELTVLNDVAASRRQLKKIGTEKLDLDKAGMAELAAFSPLFAPSGFDFSLLAYASFVDFKAKLGFPVMQIDQLGGWGTPVDDAVVVQASVLKGAETAIDTALSAWGHQRRNAHNGLPGWARLDDNNVGEEPGEDPFTGSLGAATRFVLGDGWLVKTRNWPTMRRALSIQRSLMDAPATARLLRAATADTGRGDLLVVLLTGPQASGADFAQRILGQAATPEAIAALTRELGLKTRTYLPRFTDSAIFIWQDGETFSGAIALDYPDRARAAVAMVLLRKLVGSGISMATNRPFRDVLPKNITTEVIESADGAVGMMIFTQSMADSRIGGVVRFVTNPGKRLIDMKLTRDLDILLAGD